MANRALWAPCLLAVSTLAVLLVFYPKSKVKSAFEESDGLMPDSPIAAAQFRYRQRLSEDGSIPENAYMRAVHQRNAMLSAQSGSGSMIVPGVYPGGWTWLGPGNIGGRIRGILIDPTNVATMYVGAASGGIWKTTNGGAGWFPLDDFMPTLAIGCMAMDPTNPSVLFAGTGEGFFETLEGSSNTAAVRGAGIFKSIDGGATWNQMPSTSGPDWYFVNRIAIHPTNNQHMLVATNSGLYRTLNGGATWTNTYVEHIYDVKFHPTDGNRAIAGLHDHGAIYSVDGGATWTASAGLTGHRTELCYAPSSPTTVYAALSNNDQIRIYRSTNGGVSFALQAGAGISTYAAYNNTLWVDPTNPNRIIYGGVNLYRSNDGGATRSQVFNSVHADMHAIVTQPGYNGTTNRTVFFGTDGGIYRTTDATGTAATGLNNNLGITQWYGAAMNPISGRVLAGAQDNGTKLYTGNPQAWTTTFGGDGGYCATDPTNQNYFYGEIQWGAIFRSTNGGTSASYIYNGPNPIVGVGTTQFNFIPFFMLDPNDPNRMYVGGRLLWRSNNVKAAQVDWSSIKPTIDPGGRPEGPGTGGAHFAPNPPWNISTMAIATGNSNLIYVGYNNGQVWKTTNGLGSPPNWTRVDDDSGPMPERWISKIVIDPLDPNRIYVAFMGWEADNIWLSTNGGGTWSSISGSGLFKLPSVPVSAFAVHPANPGWLYAGTDLGLFFSADDGEKWMTSNSGPAIVPFEELHWVNGDLVAVTHGRGVYQADVSSTSIPFSPESLQVIEGTHLGGRLQELYASDDRRVRIASRPGASGIVHIETTSPLVSPSKFTLTIETASNNEWSSDPVYVYLWNPAGGWESLGFRRQFIQDTVRVFPLKGSLASRYIDPLTHRVKVQFIWYPSGLASSVLSIDQVLFEVEP